MFQHTPSRPPLTTQRKTTPLRNNNRSSLSDRTIANVVLAVDRNQGTDLSEYQFTWLDNLYEGSRDKVRYRYRYTARLKLLGNRQEWKDLVSWATDTIKNAADKTSPSTDSKMGTTTRNQAASRSSSSNGGNSGSGSTLPTVPTETTIAMDSDTDDELNDRYDLTEIKKAIAEAKATVGGVSLPFSKSDGDLTPSSGPVEDVYLAGPFHKYYKDSKNDKKVRNNCWVIACLAFSASDAKDMEVKHRGSDFGNKMVSLHKWRLPDILRDMMITETVNQVFDEDDPDEEEAGNAMKTSINEVATKMGTKMKIDVHFPKPVLPDIERVDFVDIAFGLEDAEQCYECGNEPTITKVPIQCFIVREVKSSTTETQRRSGRKGKAVYRK